MQIPAQYVGPQFRAQRKKQYEMHKNRMSQIMRRPVNHSDSSTQELKNPLVSQRQRHITAQNNRMYSRLMEISSRRIVDSWPNQESELMQRYKATLRKRRLQRIREENLSLADRLTKRLTGGYTYIQQEISEIRDNQYDSARPLLQVKERTPQNSYVQLPKISHTRHPNVSVD